jgi:hypothetical protein
MIKLPALDPSYLVGISTQAGKSHPLRRFFDDGRI